MDNREKFVYVLKRLGNKASNAAMFRVLSTEEAWTPDYYVNVKEALKEEGVIKFGRGRGGTVSLVETGAL